MKKTILWTLGGLGALVLATVGGYYAYLLSLQPAKEERLNFRSDKVIAAIDAQLVGVAIDAVKAKRPYIEQKSVQELKNNLNQGLLTYQELVAYYLIRIKEEDQSATGNNAVSEINPNAMAEAKRFDEVSDDRAFAGIPILLKENISTNTMPTSAGSYALRDFIPSKNAPLVDRLLENGALILGKTNLSEMSFYMSDKAPSGYSAKKGQTTNPFNPLVLSPSGSSSGSAVAMATDLAAVTLGTETAGSIVAPASANSVVGYKPTRGGINGQGVIPITYSLDTVGPITKTVQDAVTTYNAAADQPLSVTFDPDALKGKTVGIVSTDKTFYKPLEKALTKLGAKVRVFSIDDDGQLDWEFLLKNDFEKDLNHYLTTYGAPIQSLEELVAFNKEDKKVRMRYGQSDLENALNPERDDQKVQDIIDYAVTLLNKSMDDNQVDVMVFKDNLEALLPALAGAPEVSVPFGLLEGSPVGATFFGKVGDDEKVLALAYSFEQGTQLRQIPDVD